MLFFIYYTDNDNENNTLACRHFVLLNCNFFLTGLSDSYNYIVKKALIDHVKMNDNQNKDIIDTNLMIYILSLWESEFRILHRKIKKEVADEFTRD